MAENFIHTRILGKIDVDTPEARDAIRQRIKLAAGGAIPYAVRELMKRAASRVLASDAGEQEKEQAKLLICYSRWARELESGTPKKDFEKFMLDQLNDLDDPGNLVSPGARSSKQEKDIDHRS